MIHVDTNFLIAALRPDSSSASRLEHWLIAGEEVEISTVALAEFFCGGKDVLSIADRERCDVLFPHAEPLLREDAKLAAELFNQSGRRSRTLPDYLIAAVAIRRGAFLATENRKDFEPFSRSGLRLI